MKNRQTDKEKTNFAEKEEEEAVRTSIYLSLFPNENIS